MNDSLLLFLTIWYLYAMILWSLKAYESPIKPSKFIKYTRMAFDVITTLSALYLIVVSLTSLGQIVQIFHQLTQVK
jgi:hypothetical protein